MPRSFTRFLAPVALLFCAFAVAPGCDDDAGVRSLFDAARNAPPAGGGPDGDPNVPEEPVLRCRLSRDSLDFGEVHVDSLSPPDSFWVVNPGEDTLSVTVTLGTALSPGCPDFQMLRGEGRSELAPGDSYSVVVRFQPLSPEDRLCSVEVRPGLCGLVALLGYGIAERSEDPPTFALEWGAYQNPAVAPGHFRALVDLAADEAGNVYATDRLTDRIQKFSSGGEFLAQWSLPAGSQAHGIAAAGGRVYVSSVGADAILVFDANGLPVATWGSQGTALGKFRDPRGVEAAADGSVYVADSGNNRIQKLDAGGQALLAWGSAGAGTSQFYNPYGIAVGDSGRVYVVDSQNHRVQAFDADGAFLDQWGGETPSLPAAVGTFDNPRYIAVEPDGDVVVTDKNNVRVQKFGPHGEFLAQWSDRGGAPFTAPEGIAVGPDGSVFVADFQFHPSSGGVARIVRYDVP